MARELGCSEDEAEFREKPGQIARHRPKDEPKAKNPPDDIQSRSVGGSRSGAPSLPLSDLPRGAASSCTTRTWPKRPSSAAYGRCSLPEP
jgi:hypothetical protein